MGSDVKSLLKKMGGSVFEAKEAGKRMAKKVGERMSAEAEKRMAKEKEAMTLEKSSNGLQKPKKVVKGRDTYSELRDDAKNAPRLSAEKLAGFNRYPKWLAEKGIKVGDDFDFGGKGNKYFNQFLSENKEYFKAHPERAISIEDIPSIRRELAHGRERDIDEMIKGVNASGGTSKFLNKQGQEVSGEEGDYTDYRDWINKNEKTKDPNYMGKNMSAVKFRETPKSNLPPITKEEYQKDPLAIYDEHGNYRGIQGETINTVLPGKTETIQLPQSSPKKSTGGSLSITNIKNK